MFGLLQPPTEDLDYRSVYSRCCQFQRRFFGMVSLPLLSYDAVFLYLCARDAGLIPCSIIPPQTCCRLRENSTLRHAPDAEIGRFCGALSVLFADVKFQDDVRDRRSLMARLGRFVLRRSVEKALAFFTRINPAFPEMLWGWLTAQLEVETTRTAVTLQEFVAPTAQALASLAAMMPGAANRSGCREFLADLGKHVGTAIVAADCAFDWQDDRNTGNCNPVRDVVGAAKAGRLSLECLAQAVAACESYLGRTARSATLGRSMIAALASRLRRICPLDFSVVEEDALEQPSHRMNQQDGILGRCVSGVKWIGAQIPGFERKLECPRVCQCSSQVVCGLLLFLGCFEHKYSTTRR